MITERLGRAAALAFAVAMLAGAATAQSPNVDPVMNPAASGGASLSLRGPDGKTASLSAAQLHDMRRVSVTTLYGAHRTYEGVPLTDLLELVGGPSDVRLHLAAFEQMVLVKAPDGFFMPLSIAETSKAWGKGVVIIADQVDGKPLDEKEGPYRLVFGADAKSHRSVKHVSEIELRRLSIDLAAGPEPKAP